MELPENRFKRAIAEGRLQLGLWSSLCSNIAADVIGDSGFDWVLLDTEHAPNELPILLSQLQALARSSTVPIVRPAWNDPVRFKGILDLGAQSLLVPFVETPDEARQAVAATRYPPTGLRGVTASGRAGRYGRIKDYLRTADREICVLVQVETRTALNQLDAIANVEGVDGVFIGPADLAASLGHIGNPGHDEVQSAIRNALERVKEAGKPAGVLTANEEEARRYIEWGFTFVAVGVDLVLLARAADSLATRYKA